MFLRSSPAGVSWLVVCLGNPGPKYEWTRHNAGFIVCDVLAKRAGVSVNRAKFKALTAVCEIGGQSVMLMKPQTYMNLSGEAAGEAARFYKIPPEHVIVVSDEMSLPVGSLRVRPKGSSGGHNGLKSIIAHLGTEDFPRIRLGIGEPPHEDFEGKDWVLSVFRNKDAEDISAAACRACDAIECYIKYGADKAMNEYNRKK